MKENGESQREQKLENDKNEMGMTMKRNGGEVTGLDLRGRGAAPGLPTTASLSTSLLFSYLSSFLCQDFFYL